jgi:hypothetical protein
LLAAGDGCDSIAFVTPASESLPADLAAAHAMILAERQARLAAEAEAASTQADLSSSEAPIAHLKLEIEKLRHTLYGARSERTARILDQLELQLEEVEASATEDELVAACPNFCPGSGSSSAKRL